MQRKEYLVRHQRQNRLHDFHLIPNFKLALLKFDFSFRPDAVVLQNLPNRYGPNPVCLFLL